MIHISVSNCIFQEYNNDDVIDFEFKPAIIEANFKSVVFPESFKVFACKSNNPDVAIYIRPMQKYQVFEFEYMFKFGCDCSGYNINKVMAVKYIKGKENGVRITEYY